MKRLIHNLLVLIIFLSPIVHGFEMRSCHTKNTNSSQEIHHQHEKQENQIICLGHCCQNCQCDDVMTAVLINNLDINGDVQIHHIEYKIDFMVFVPFQETQPLLRPPIV